VSGWISPPSEHDHNAVVLPADDNDEYPWICSCGVNEVEITYQDAHQAVGEHLAYYQLADAPCAGLALGQHWYELVVALAHGLAGDEDEPFPARLTKDGIHGLFVQAKAMLAELEPGMDQMCRMCAEWERDINIARR
jgi:hypothetical protein